MEKSWLLHFVTSGHSNALFLVYVAVSVHARLRMVILVISEMPNSYCYLPCGWPVNFKGNKVKKGPRRIKALGLETAVQPITNTTQNPASS